MKNARHELQQGMKEYAANIVFFFLLVIRIIDNGFLGLTLGIFNSPQFDNWYSGCLYILTVLLVWLNRKILAQLNIDKYTIYLLLSGGCIWLIYLPSDLGLLATLSIVFIFFALRTSQFTFSNDPIKYPPEIWLLILISIGVAVAPIFYYKLGSSIVFDFKAFFVACVEAHLALVVFEEILFRGALWSFLNSFGLNDRTILLLQAFLFWISHHKYISLENPYIFWFSLPLNALLYGLMVWRSKSLTPSIIGHFIYNFISVFVINALS